MKKKLLGMLLAGTLMVGAVGSYAWFTDQATVDSNIKLTMGTLDLDVKEHTDGWVIVDEETSEIINKDATRHFKNVRPGDSFQREFLVSNSGTLKQRVTVKLNEEVANEVVAIVDNKAVTFDELFNLTFKLGEAELPMSKAGEVSFILDSVYTEEDGADPTTSAANMKVNLEVDKKAMDNRFNAEGNEFQVRFDFLKDKKVPLVVINAEQVNAEHDNAE